MTAKEFFKYLAKLNTDKMTVSEFVKEVDKIIKEEPYVYRKVIKERKKHETVND